MIKPNIQQWEHWQNAQSHRVKENCTHDSKKTEISAPHMNLEKQLQALHCMTEDYSATEI